MAQTIGRAPIPVHGGAAPRYAAAMNRSKGVLLSLLLVWLPVARAVAQDELVRSLDDDQLVALVAKLRPAVEQACGRTFAKAPQVYVSDQGELKRVMRVELARQVEAFYRGNPRNRIQKALQMRADLSASGLLGKFVFESGEVLVVPPLVKATLDLLGMHDADADAVLQLVVMHELVHALQEQEVGLGARFAKLEDLAAVESLNLLAEGHAVFCSERAARALGLGGAVAPVRAIFRGRTDSFDTVAVGLHGRRSERRGEVVYLRGAAIVERAFERGGVDATWELLAGGASCVQLLRGDGEQVARVEDASASVAALREQFAGKTWTVGVGPISPVQLVIENFHMRDSLVQLFAGWRRGAEWFAMAPTPAAWRAVYAFGFADEQAATRFVGVVAAGVSRDPEKTGERPEFADGPAIDGGACVRARQERSWTQPGVEVLLFRRGANVVQVTTCNADAEDEELVRCAESVLKELERLDDDR